MDEVKRLVKEGACRVTGVAEQNARDELGWLRAQVLECVLKLHLADFYKTMPSEQNPGLYQDVYRPFAKTPLCQGGVQIYCKVQIVQGRTAVVIQCKRK